MVDNSKGSDAAAEALVKNENVYEVVEDTYEADEFVIYVAQIGETKYETLQEAIDAAADGAAIILLTSTTETVEITKALTINLNGCSASSVTAGAGFELDSSDASKLVVTAVVGKAAYITKNGVTNYYETLEAAIAAAASGDTIVMMEDASVTYVMVAVDVTLDLNGNDLTAATLLYSQNGYLIDAVGGGVVKASNYIMNRDNKGYLPVYDSASGGYQLALFETGVVQDGNTIIYWVETENESALNLLKQSGNGNLKAVVDVTWTESDSTNGYQRFTFNDTLNESYWADHLNSAFYFTIGGLTAEMGIVGVTPKITSSMGAADTNVWPEIVVAGYTYQV